MVQCSALEGRGIAEIWATVSRFQDTRGKSGALAAHRAGQARAWMWSEISETLTAEFRGHPKVAERLTQMEDAVAAGEMTPAQAAAELLSTFVA